MDQRIATYTDLPVVKMNQAVDSAKTLIALINGIEIQDAEQADQYGELLKAAHEKVKELDEYRKEIGKPAREAQKDINAFFKPAIDAYSEAKELIKSKLEAYHERVHAENSKALEKASAGDGEALMSFVPEAPASGTSTRKELRIEVVDFDVIPRFFLCVDYSALKIHAKEGKEAPPGIRFRWAQKVVVGK